MESWLLRNVGFCRLFLPFYVIVIKGFKHGSIYWDDEDDDNGNSLGGMVPTGDYGSNTKVSYCCRTDGSAHSSIYLPTKDNFYLLMGPSSPYCQQVNFLL